MKIEDTIQQERFIDEYQKAVLSILVTSNWITGINAAMLKPYGLSVQQFNILRILRGQKGKPASVKLLQERMIDKMSNASRLVDKLLKKGYVDRQESVKDRRQVEINITEEGKELLDQIDQDMASYEKFYHAITPEEAKIISVILDKMRG